MVAVVLLHDNQLKNIIMKKSVVTALLMLTGLVLNAQTEKKEATIRIKRVENINGVEKVTDTTFTTSNPEEFKWSDKDGNIKINEVSSENGKVMKIVTIDEVGPETKMMTESEINAEIEKALKEAGVDANGKEMKKVMVIHDSESGNDKKSEKHYTKIVMVKLDITDASDEELKRLGSSSDKKLEMEEMKLYPNPNNGKFNLNFTLKNKGDAEITVYDMQGKQVYNERLPNFQGEYNKPIDISSNAKGIYFVKILQGKHTQVKKISLD